MIILIDVCQHSRAFFVLKGAGTASLGYSGGIFNRYLHCYIGILIDFDAVQYSVGCAPVTGEPNSIGDRSCHHYNWQGSLNVLPADVFTTAYRQPGSTYDTYYPWYILGTGSTAQGFTILSQYGESGNHYLTETFIYNKQEYTHSVSVNWFWKDDKTLIMHLAYTSSLNNLFDNVSVVHEFDRAPTRENIRKLKSRQITNVLYRQQTADVFNDMTPIGAWKTPKLTAVSSETLEPSSKKSIVDALQREGQRFEYCLPDIPKEMWGDLTDVAAQNARALDINSIAYARDLLKIKESCDEIIRLLHGKLNLRALADAWLSFKYGFRLLIADSEELGNALSRSIAGRRKHKGYSVCRAMDKSVSIATKGPLRGYPVLDQYNLKLYYSPDSDKFLSLCKVMMDWDTFPSLQNIWDWIPFSFVVDWFTDFSRTLERIDTNTYISTVDVSGVIKTRKSSIQSVPVDKMCLPGKTVWSGCLDLDIYSRNLSSHLTLPLLRLGSPEEFHNIVELLAIIIQKGRR